MFQMYRIGIGALAILIAAGVAFAGTVTMDEPITAQGEFLTRSSNDNCSSPLAAPGCTSSGFNPTFINVSALDGDTVNLLAMGAICYFGGTSCTTPAYLIGVFSSSDTLTPGDYISSGLPDVPSATYFGDVNNTVTQDFYISYTPPGTSVVVPAGANWLIAGVLDSFYADNTSDPSLQLSYLAQSSVPEPSSYAMALAGMAGLAAFRRMYRVRK